MMLASYVPDLTPEEAKRFWLTPVEVCRLAAIGESSDPAIKKMLNTLSDRGHVPFVKSGEAKTAPRLYSLVSAAMLRTISEIIADGRTYRYAEAVAQEVARKLLWATGAFADLTDFDLAHVDDRVLFAGIRDNGTPAAVQWFAGDAIPGNHGMVYSLFEAGYAIFRLCGTYADFWAEDLHKRGILNINAPAFKAGLPIWKEADDTPQFDADGRPIWGRD